MSKVAYDWFDYKYVKMEDTATEGSGYVSIISLPAASQLLTARARHNSALRERANNGTLTISWAQGIAKV